ncbi:MAG: 16S rRNA (guanine(966)-N(2))-methyltransferase RsmD [Myxococcota bacterium]
MWKTKKLPLKKTKPRSGRLRIVAGRLRGRWIAVPAAAARGLVRPLTTKVREAIFSALHGRAENSRVLDLFAGSGSSGLEALSRGARSVTFVERDAPTLACLERNVADLDVAELCTLFRGDAIRYVVDAMCQSDEQKCFGLVFLDPPYPVELPEVLWERLPRLLAEDGLIIFRCHRSRRPRLPERYRIVRERCYGDMLVLFLAPVAKGSAKER